MHHFRMPQAQSVPHSGLTGPADIPEPPPERPRDVRSRIRQLRQGANATLVALPRVLRLVWRASPGLTIGLAAATVLSGVVPAATAYLSKELINAVFHAMFVHLQHGRDVAQLGPIATTTIGAIVWLAAAQFAIFAVSSAMGAVRNITQQLLQERITLQTQLQIMEHASRLDLAFFEDSASYDLLRRAQEEAASRPLMMVSQAFGLIQTTITFASMIAILIHVSWVLAVIALVAPIPAFISDTRYGWRGFNLARWASPLRRRMQYLLQLSTTDTAAKEVKLFDLGDYLVQRFQLLSSTYYERQRKLVTRRYLVGNLWSLISTLVGSGTYLYVALQAVAGRLTPGDLLLYVQAAGQIQQSVQGILSGLSSMYEHNLYLTNLFDLLEVESRIRLPENPRPLPAPLRGEIVFEHVSFRYPGASSGEALRDVSFRIAAGETIAVVGRNGAGKSTLIKLLCRLYDPSEGRILLDGIDIREFDPAQLRSVMSAMFQDFVTYQATASENIGLGHLERLENQLAIVAAARRGGAGELIEALRSGYDTPLGKWFDQGVNLSGGEWQKVALGRAFMRDDARILVLDEPTSALDAQAEYDLFARLRQLSEGRTAIYISHRFSTVRQADRILFLEHGRLVEDGTHQQLMDLGGRYARLFTLQASAYTGEEVVLPEDLPA
jgi:ATP-binding cassette, subfamily B, bacterial